MKLFNIILGVTLVFFTVMFMRCEKVTEITELVKNTEHIQVTFYNDTLPDTYVTIDDKGEIKKFADFISSEDVPVRKCDYDGQIVFFMDETIAAGAKNSVSMEFNLNGDCRHIQYMYADALQTKKLTDEGKEYLEKLHP